MFPLFRVIWSLLETLVNKCIPTKPKDISGQVVLITGTAQGIGQQLAYRFAQQGVKLVLLDVNEKGNLETEENLKSMGTQCKAFRCDVTNREEIARISVMVRHEFGTVNILVNNAGVAHLKNFLRSTDSEIRQTIEVNLLGPIWMVREFLPDMVARNEGHIVNVSSIAGHIAFPLGTDYCASKFGIRGFGEGLSADLERLGKDGVRVSTVYPAAVDTNMVRGAMNRGDLVFWNEQPLMKSELVADAVVKSVLLNKKQIFLPGELWRLPALANLLPVKTMEIINKSQKFGFYEKVPID